MSPAALRDATNELPPAGRRARFKAPAWLSVEAKRFFTELVLDLEEAAPGTIGRLDVPALALIAQHYATAQSASEAMRKHGNRVEILEVDNTTAAGGQLRKRAAWQVFRQATSSYLTLAREYGLTLKARESMELDAGGVGDASDDEDDLESKLG